MQVDSPPSPELAQIVPPDRPTGWKLLLTNRDFMILWGGFTISSLGTSLSNLAIPVLALGISQSPSLVGLVSAARLAPYILLNLLAGVLIDRWDRRKVMIVADFVRFAALLSVPLAYMLNALTIPHLALVAFIEGVGHVCYGVAHLAALPRVVPEEQIASANGLNEVGDSVATVAGPALSGLLIGIARNTTLGAIYSYIVDAITYLLSGVLLFAIRTPFQTVRASVEQPSIWRSLVEGMQFLWRKRLLRLLMVITTLVNFLQAPLYLCTIVLATEVLMIDAVQVGLVFSLAGFGTVASALSAAWFRQRLGLGKLILGSVLLWAGSAALMADAGSIWLLIIGLLLTNLLWPIYAVALVSYRLEVTPDDLQGRVNSAFRNLSLGVEPLGVALGGLLIAIVGPRLLLWGIAAGLALGFLASLLVWRRWSADEQLIA